VWLCLIVNLLVFAGIMFGRNSRDSLFLYYFGVKYLPYMYFANAVSLVVCSLAYTTLVDQIERGKLLAGISLLFVAGLVASRAVVGGHPHWFFPVLYVEAQVIWYFSLMQFWTFAGDLFDTRQAKRLFPLLAVGGLLGMISVGVFCKQIIRALGTENLLLVWAGLIAAALILGGITYRRYRRREEPAKVDPMGTAKRLKPSEWQKIKDGMGELGREPLQRTMAGYVLLLWTVFAIIDFCYSSTVREQFKNDPNGLTTFLGHFVGVQGLCCLTIQLFFTRAVIARLGVGTTINFHAALNGLGAAWMSLRYGFPSVVSTKLADASMLYTFSDSSYQLLYSPIPPDRRARVRGFIEGYIKPMSLAAAGVLVLLGNSYLKPLTLRSGAIIKPGQQLSWGALMLALTWLAIALTAKRGYIRALLHNLQADSPALRLAAVNALGRLRDPAGLNILSQTLQSEDPERVVTAVRFLENFGSEQAIDTMARLLSHSDARVRATAAAVLGRRAGAKYHDQLAALLHDPDARVRANSIEALAPGLSGSALESIRPLLEDPAKRVRVNALLALAACEGMAATEQWLPLVEELAHGDRESRATAIFALGRLPLDASVGVLIELLRDPDPSLRAEAARALGQVGTAGAITSLVEALSGPASLRQVARRSLAALLERCESPCIQELAEMALASPRPEIRSELADVLGRLDHPQVVPTLITLLKDPEWRVRWKVLKSFEHRARSAPLPPEARAALFQYASDELTSFRQSLACSHALLPHPASSAEHLLDVALQEDRVKIEERVFHMLGILCGREQMHAVFSKLQSGDARLRADALEALDNLAPKTIGRQLLEVLEPAPAPISPQAVPCDPFLQALTQHSKPWVRACHAYHLAGCRCLYSSAEGSTPWVRPCAAYYAGQYPAGSPPAAGRTLLKTLLADRDHVVRETALYAGWLAFRDAWQGELEAARQSCEPTLQHAAQRLLAPYQSPVSAESSRDTQRLGTGLTVRDSGPGVRGSGQEAQEPPTPKLESLTPKPETPTPKPETRTPDLERSPAMLLTVEKVLFLKSAPLFAALNSEELAALADIALEEQFAPGEVIFKEGQAAHHLYVLARGKVEVFRRANSSEYPIATLGEKECFGEMAILDDAPRSASVKALEETQVLKIDRESFRELITERPQIAFAIFKILTSRLRHADMAIEQVASFDSARHAA
jgi:HEAT repeat protein